METLSKEKKHKRKKKLDSEIDLNESLKSTESDEAASKAEAEAEVLKDLKKEKIKKRKQENVAFLNSVLKQVKYDSCSTYRHDILSLDYNKISQDMGGISASDFRKKLNKFLQPLEKVKSLYQVLSDTYSFLLKEHKGKPAGFKLFMIANSKLINKTIEKKKKRKGDPTTIANQMWNNLTDGEKLAYEGITALGKSPVDIYYETVREQDSSLSLPQVRRIWVSLPMEEREEYIKKSAQIKMSILDKENREKITNADQVVGPSDDDMVEYLRYLGMPERPIQKYQISYLWRCGKYDDSMSTQERFVLAAKIFKALPINEQVSWISKHEKVHRKYEKTLNRWEESLNEINQFLMKLYRKYLERKNKKNEQTKRVKHLYELNTVVMPHIKIKFEFSPSTVPPVTVLQVYRSQRKGKTGVPIHQNDAMKNLAKFSQIEKDILKAKGENNKRDYVKKLKDYVDNLSEEERRFFLGFNRFDFMKVLKEDVFEGDYPDSEYPVFVKERSQKDKLGSTESLSESDTKNKNGDKSAKKAMELAILDILDEEFESCPSETKSNSSNSKVSKSKKVKTNKRSSKNNENGEVEDQEESGAQKFSEKSKRKGSDSSKNKKRRKLNEDKVQSMVKLNNETSESDDEDVKLDNIKKYMSTLRFKTENGFDGIIKKE